MPETDLALAKTNLQTVLATITGIKNSYRAIPTKPPDAAQCPAFVISYREPSWDDSPLALGKTQYVWHLEIRLLYCPAGTQSASEREKGIEPFPARIHAKLSANNSLAQAITSVRFASSGRIGFFTMQFPDGSAMDYYGLTRDLDLIQNIAETYTP